jgi:hypothetical protein
MVDVVVNRDEQNFGGGEGLASCNGATCSKHASSKKEGPTDRLRLTTPT